MENMDLKYILKNFILGFGWLEQTEIQSWIQEVKYALIDNDVQRATEIQAREILPRAEFVRRQMYEEMNVVLKKDTYTLVQEPVQSYKTEELLSEAPAVIHFGKSWLYFRKYN